MRSIRNSSTFVDVAGLVESNYALDIPLNNKKIAQLTIILDRIWMQTVTEQLCGYSFEAVSRALKGDNGGDSLATAH